ncbi:hypothetical protein FB451DRAFT_998423, partial [Mycena latifolia]
DAEISRRESKLSKADRAALRSYYNSVLSLRSPIRRLPTETLVDIFTLSATLGSNLNLIERLAQKPLLVLAQVCSRWCVIVLGTSALWPTIDFDVPGMSHTWRRSDKVMELLQLTLDRSAQWPLNLVL